MVNSGIKILWRFLHITASHVWLFEHVSTFSLSFIRYTIVILAYPSSNRMQRVHSNFFIVLSPCIHVCRVSEGVLMTAFLFLITSSWFLIQLTVFTNFLTTPKTVRDSFSRIIWSFTKIFNLLEAPLLTRKTSVWLKCLIVEVVFLLSFPF